MFSIFSRKIAIWYKDEEWKEYIKNTIIDETLPEVLISISEQQIIMSDGTEIRFIPMEPSCGQRFDLSFVQFTKKPDEIMQFINKVIKATTLSGDIFPIKEYEDFLRKPYRKFTIINGKHFWIN